MRIAAIMAPPLWHHHNGDAAIDRCQSARRRCAHMACTPPTNYVSDSRYCDCATGRTAVAAECPLSRSSLIKSNGCSWPGRAAGGRYALLSTTDSPQSMADIGVMWRWSAGFDLDQLSSEPSMRVYVLPNSSSGAQYWLSRAPCATHKNAAAGMMQRCPRLHGPRQAEPLSSFSTVALIVLCDAL